MKNRRKRKANTYKNVWRFFKFLKPYKFKGFIVGLGISFNVLLKLPMPLLTMYLIDEALLKGKRREFFIIIGLLILATIIQLVINYFTYRTISELRQKVFVDLKSRLFAKIQKLPLDFFKEKKPGEIISYISHDVNASEGLLFDTIISFIINILQFIVVIIILFFLHVKLTIITLCVMPFFAISLKTYSKRLRRLGKSRQIKEAKTLGLLTELITGMRLIKSFVREKYELKKFTKNYNSLIKDRLALTNTSLLSKVLNNFFASLGPIMIMMYGGYEVINGELSLGKLVAFSSFLSYLYGPLDTLTNINTLIQSAIAPIDRIFSVLDRKEEHLVARRVCPEFKQGEIIFRNVSFSYDNKNFVLKNINLTIPAKSSIALVGATGSGKSTLAQLIEKFYIPQKGDIFIDAYNLKDLNYDCVRRQIGEVTQNTFIFYGSIKDNIRYGKISASDDEVMRAAKIANIHNFIMNLPEKYDTIIDSKGMSLSGGQLQRIAIARAIIKYRSIIIMDEATSALDVETEKQVQKALENIKKHSTTIFIAHRLPTIYNADQIAVLDQGEIVQLGNQHALYKQKSGIYRKLVDLLESKK